MPKQVHQCGQCDARMRIPPGNVGRISRDNSEFCPLASDSAVYHQEIGCIYRNSSIKPDMDMDICS